jgi:hypothetical protein
MTVVHFAELFDYKPYSREETVEIGLIRDTLALDEAAPVLEDTSDQGGLVDLVCAVIGIAEGEMSFLDHLRDIKTKIPVNVDKSLWAGLGPLEFVEVCLDPIADSSIFDVLQDTLETSEDDNLLTESASFILTCACASQSCMVSIASTGLHDSLFSMVPRLFAIECERAIIEILNALALIWKRLRTCNLPAIFSNDCLDEISDVVTPFTDQYVLPYLRLVTSLLVFASPDEEQIFRLTKDAYIILYPRFLMHSDSVVPEMAFDLAQFVDIALILSRCECLNDRFIVSPSHPFIGISRSLHLLPPPAASRFLFFYDECERFFIPEMMRELLSELDCGTLIHFLSLGNFSLTESSLNVISLMIEFEIISGEQVLPEIVHTALKSLEEDRFRLKRAAMRFIHAIVQEIDWMVLPDGAFRIFVTAAHDLVSSENENESMWFLECVLLALRTQVEDFAEHVMVVCGELGIWGTIEKLPAEYSDFECMCGQIGEARKAREG